MFLITYSQLLTLSQTRCRRPRRRSREGGRTDGDKVLFPLFDKPQMCVFLLTQHIWFTCTQTVSGNKLHRDCGNNSSTYSTESHCGKVFHFFPLDSARLEPLCGAVESRESAFQSDISMDAEQLDSRNCSWISSVYVSSAEG